MRCTRENGNRKGVRDIIHHLLTNWNCMCMCECVCVYNTIGDLLVSCRTPGSVVLWKIGSAITSTLAFSLWRKWGVLIERYLITRKKHDGKGGMAIADGLLLPRDVPQRRRPSGWWWPMTDGDTVAFQYEVINRTEWSSIITVVICHGRQTNQGSCPLYEELVFPKDNTILYTLNNFNLV